MKWIGDEDPRNAELDCAAAGYCEPRPQRAKKDTKKWCRGKVGISHQPVSARRQYGDRFPCHVSDGPRGRYIHCWHQEECASCGKILNYWPDRKLCPDLFPASD